LAVISGFEEGGGHWGDIGGRCLLDSEPERFGTKEVQNQRGSEPKRFRTRKDQTKEVGTRKVHNLKGSEPERFGTRKVRYLKDSGSVTDTAQSELSGIIVTAESKLGGLSDTAKSKLCGFSVIVDTAKLDLPVSLTPPSKNSAAVLSPLSQTQRCRWHRWVEPRWFH
jgi:hypothetical protein